MFKFTKTVYVDDEDVTVVAIKNKKILLSFIAIIYFYNSHFCLKEMLMCCNFVINQ